MERANQRENIIGRAEIDTRAPFRSVREAVALFGEKVLAGEIYANKLKEIGANVGPSPKSKVRSLTAELEETKQSLEITRQENTGLSQYINALRKELEQTRRELQKLKANQEIHQKRGFDDPEIEELKFIEKQTSKKEDDEDEELDKRRLVRFASPPSLTRVIVSKKEEKKMTTMDRPPSVKKTTKKMKPLIPLIGWLFSRKKGNQDDAHSPILGY